MRMWTFWTAVFLMITLSVISKFGYTLPVLARRGKFLLSGNVRPARGFWHWKKYNPKSY
jgi:hypothetical protein